MCSWPFFSGPLPLRVSMSVHWSPQWLH
jgi:hypothetical protein